MATHRICSVEGCDKPQYKRDWCNAHYIRWRRHGTPLGGGTSHGEPMRYYLEVVLPYDGAECHFWPYGCLSAGYAELRVDGAPRHVHRMVCAAKNGPPPTPEHEAAHSCGNGHLGCCAGRHLSWKTRTENMADKTIHGTENIGERNGQAKLTEPEVLEILALAGTVPQTAIGERFGVERTTISSIHTRKSWPHLRP